MKDPAKTLLVIVVSFGLYFLFDDWYFKEIRKELIEILEQRGISHILTYAITGIPLFAGTYLLGGKAAFLRNLGLDQSIAKGFLFAAICTLPMFLGFGLLFDFNTEITVDRILIGVVAAGFFEELYFRGFLFGLPFKKTKLGFIPVVFLGALYFGGLHLYQSSELSELVGIFAITFLGAILFAWVYAEWNFNIWVPLFLHMLMNLAWELFSVSENALGGNTANIFRFATVALVIVLTIRYKKRKGLKRLVTKRTLFPSRNR